MTFELDRFAWVAGALEVSGRWRSETPRRFRHVRLVVEEDGRRRRIAPSKQTPMRATPEGEPWAATFPWEGDAPPEAPLLEAGQSLLVELPAPTPVLVAPVAAPTQADVDALRAELEAERARVASLRRELEAERARVADVQAEAAAEHRRELEEAWKAARELEAERSAIAAERERLTAERDALQAAEQPAPVRTEHRWALGASPPEPPSNGSGPRHGAIQHALELPRQPDDHVRGKAPLAVRIIALALCAGVLVMLGMILGAVL